MEYKLTLEQGEQKRDETLQVVGARSHGLANLWRRESWAWWRQWRWAWHALVWLLLLNSVLLIIAVNPKPGQSSTSGAMNAFFLSTFSFVGLGVILLLQGVILNERQSGTIAWILSKPVMRSSFILAKFAAFPGMFLTMILLPGVVGYGELLLLPNKNPPLIPYVLGMTFLAVTLFTLFCVMLLCGIVLKNRIAVIAIPFVILMVSLQLLATPLMPHILQGEVLVTLTALGIACVVAIALLVVGIKVFEREEF